LHRLNPEEDDERVTTTRIIARLCLLAASLITAAQAAPPPDHWVGTWATADLERANKDGAFGATDTTLRQIVHVSIGGPMVRIELSNAFGTDPLTVSAAHLALAGSAKGEIALPSASALTFGGRATIVIPPGAVVVSDPVAMKLAPESDLVISMFLPAQKITHLTVHNSAYQTNYIAPGNVVGEKSLPGDGIKTNASWFFLKAVDVKAPAAAGAIVAFGDSITDGTFSTPDLNKRWPDFLARRLQADKKLPAYGVLNEGIGGNRVLHDGTGPSALARFDSDVLGLDGVKYVILLESINDIGHAADPVKPYDIVSADDLIQGIAQLVERAHEHSIKVIGATLTPYTGTAKAGGVEGAKYMSPAGEIMRKAVNQFIRTSPIFDGVIDFENATTDKATGAFDARFDHGDHLHPNDAGMEAMANSIDLKLFLEK
jgi:lysophospholipase L1-like esterase